jgi:hypothetical protein
MALRSYAENNAQRPLLEVKAELPCCGAVISGFDPVQTSGVQCNRLPGCRMASIHLP